jgi:hypothetical protein
MEDFYDKLEEMDDRLVILATKHEMDFDTLKRIHDQEKVAMMLRHKQEEENLMHIFYDGMELVMTDYKDAIEEDIRVNNRDCPSPYDPPKENQ